MNLASIQVITDIRPIEVADRIEAATVLGYQTVIKKGEFRPGDLCVWHEPDTVAAEKPEYEFLRKQGFRLTERRPNSQRHGAKQPSLKPFWSGFHILNGWRSKENICLRDLQILFRRTIQDR